jgi:hypothetical protein
MKLRTFAMVAMAVILMTIPGGLTGGASAKIPCGIPGYPPCNGGSGGGTNTITGVVYAANPYGVYMNAPLEVAYVVSSGGLSGGSYPNYWSSNLNIVCTSTNNAGQFSVTPNSYFVPSGEGKETFTTYNALGVPTITTQNWYRDGIAYSVKIWAFTYDDGYGTTQYGISNHCYNYPTSSKFGLWSEIVYGNGGNYNSLNIQEQSAISAWTPGASIYYSVGQKGYAELTTGTSASQETSTSWTSTSTTTVLGGITSGSGTSGGTSTTSSYSTTDTIGPGSGADITDPSYVMLNNYVTTDPQITIWSQEPAASGYSMIVTDTTPATTPWIQETQPSWVGDVNDPLTLSTVNGNPSAYGKWLAQDVAVCPGDADTRTYTETASSSVVVSSNVDSNTGSLTLGFGDVVSVDVFSYVVQSTVTSETTLSSSNSLAYTVIMNNPTPSTGSSAQTWYFDVFEQTGTISSVAALGTLHVYFDHETSGSAGGCNT